VLGLYVPPALLELDHLSPTIHESLAMLLESEDQLGTLVPALFVMRLVTVRSSFFLCCVLLI